MNRKIITALTIIFIFGIILAGCDNFNLIELLNNDISIIPEEITLSFGETVQFEVSAGIAPFTFTEIGDGSISKGIYTAPGTAGSYTILVEDGRNRTAEAEITVVDPATQILLTPQIVSTSINGTASFTISGGTPDGTNGYTITVLNSLGAIVYDPLSDQYSFDYTANAVAGNDVIQVSDTLGQIVESSITITSNTNLQINPAVAQVLTGGADFPFSASGGDGVYSFYIDPPSPFGDSSINIANGRYSPPGTNTGVETVRVEDGLGAIAYATVYIVDALLTINPSVSITLYIGDEYTFSASNGVQPYTFSILGNEPSGSIDSGSGLFTALTKDPNVTVVVTDGNGNTSTCKVKIKN